MTKLPKVPGGRNTTWPLCRCGAIARAMSACAIAGLGTTISSAPASAAPRSAVAMAIATSRRPRSSTSTIPPASTTGASAAASRRHRRTS